METQCQEHAEAIYLHKNPVNTNTGDICVFVGLINAQLIGHICPMSCPERETLELSL